MSDLPLFLGRFHPVLVHLPIGLLVAAGGLQAWAWWRRGREQTRAEGAIGPLLVLAAAVAAIAAAAGVLLGDNGGYSGDLFERHRVLGLALAASAALTAGAWLLASRHPGRAWRPVYSGLLVVTVGLVVAAGHAGGALTHGEEYLTELAPGWLQALAGNAGPEAGGTAVPPAQRVAFDALVEPVLARRCVSCHGAVNPQGGLRLDTAAGLEAGGDGGGVVTPGRPASSALWQRVSLPPSHPDAMPPRGRPPMSAGEGALVRWWIVQGASFEALVGELELPPETRQVVEALLGPLPLEGPTLPPGPVAPADLERIAEAEAAGFALRPIAEGVPFLQVSCRVKEPGDLNLRALEPLQAQVAWLDLGRTGVDDSGLEAVGTLANLVRLDLSRTAVTDAGLAHLSALEHLETLNLFGTAVTDAGLVHLEALGSLRRLYLWQTATSAAGVDRLRSVLPALETEAGSEPEVSRSS